MEDKIRMMVMAGGILAAVAGLAWLADRRRHRRQELDRVGCMPWTMLFFWALMGAVLLLGLAGRVWLTG